MRQTQQYKPAKQQKEATKPNKLPAEKSPPPNQKGASYAKLTVRFIKEISMKDAVNQINFILEKLSESQTE